MIELVVFFTGAVIMALEVLGTRALNPAFGSGLYVWAALITVTLVSLALGYFLGGLAADRWPRRAALFLLLVVTGVLLAGIVAATPLVLTVLEPMELRTGALAGAFALFGLPLLLLGMVTPYSVRLRTQEVARVGQVAGRLYAIGTVGSVVGTLVTAFWLIPNVGHGPVFLVLSGLLGVVGGAGLLFSGRRGGGVAAVLLIPAAAIALQMTAPEAESGDGAIAESETTAEGYRTRDRVVYDSEGVLGRITVLDREFLENGRVTYVDRLFLLDGACQSHLPPDPADGVHCEYIRLFDLMTRWRPVADNCYLIGLAGGSIVRLLSPYDLEFDAADIDARSLEVARKHFASVGNARLHFHLEDGRRQLRRMGKRFDYIVIDMLTIDAVPFHLYSKEAFEEARDKLKPGGILAINSSLTYDRDGHFSSQSMNRTLRAVFPHVRCYRAHVDPEIGTENRVFFASTEPFTGDPDPDPMEEHRVAFPPNVGMVYTDAHNPFDVLLATTSDVYRKSFRELFPEVARIRGR